MTAVETNEFEIERLAGLRTFDVLVQHPMNGKLHTERVLAHFHTTDDEGHLSFVQINIDGSRSIGDLFNVNHWVRLKEIGTSLTHASKLVVH